MVSSPPLSPTEEAKIYETAQRARIQWLKEHGYDTHRENGKPYSTAPVEEQRHYKIAQWRLLQHGREKKLKSKTKQQEEQLHEAWLKKMEEAQQHEAKVLLEAAKEEERKKNKKKNKK